jgi:adenylate cyclase
MVRVGFVLGIPLWAAVGLILPLVVTIDATVLFATVAAMMTVDAISLAVVRGEPSLDRIEAVGVAGTIANALAILVLSIAAPEGTTYTLAGLMLTTLYAVAVFRIALPTAIVPMGAVLAAYAVAAAPQLPPGQVVFEVFILGSMMVIGVIGVIALDRAAREGFLQRRTIETQREQVAREKAKSDALLRTILPGGIVELLRERREAVADRHDATSLLFADLVGFTVMAERLGPQRTAALLNGLVSRWDVLAAEAEVEKIKTIGDAYFAAAGVPRPQEDHARRIVELGLAMIRATAETARTTGEPLAIRVGVHSGPVVAGVIGRTKFAYDLWGDTVNVASRLESTGIPGEIQASAETVALLDGLFEIVPRGKVDLKGKGPTATFLVRARETAAGAGPSGREGR